MPTAPLIIVGAGPVGLSLGLALRQAGVPALILEHRSAIPQDHRATTLQPPTLEMLAGWGVLDQVLSHGRRIDRLQYWDWISRTLLADLDFSAIGEHTACPYRAHVHQWHLSQVLLDTLQADFPGTVHLGHKVVGVQDHGRSATVDVQTRDGSEHTLEASWVIACDGHGSTVRTRLGIGWQAEAAPQAFLTCAASLDVLEGMGGIASLATLFGTGGWTLMMQMREAVRFLFQSSGDRAVLTKDAMAARARTLLGPGAEGALAGVSMYTVRPALAETFRRGRVLLAGDSAHSAYPVGGTAMNCGIHDAFFLAGALITGGEAALDAYASSRRAWAHRQLIAQASESLRAVSARGPFRRQSRKRTLWRLGERPDEARIHLLRLSMLDDGQGQACLPAHD